MRRTEPPHPLALAIALLAFATLLVPATAAHGVAEGDRQFIVDNEGPQIGPFLYLGAKHMVTGYDHLLFLVGVIFFLYRLKEVAVYVSMFTLGHSLTLLVGVLANVPANVYMVDAIIGLSVVYKGFDNLGGFKRLLGYQPNTKAAVLIFGLFHGFGLATKLQEFELGANGLVANILAFNVGVEIGQILALGVILLFMTWWRPHPSFHKHTLAANTFLMAGGLVLLGYQVTGYFVST